MRQNFHDDKPEKLAYRPEAVEGAEEGDGTQFRPYINFALVKVLSSDVIKSEKAVINRNRATFLEQKFKITKDTTFAELRDECTKFWDIYIDKDNYTLMQPSMHDMMCVNKDKTHQANTVAKYFEIQRAKKVVLLLMKPPK